MHIPIMMARNLPPLLLRVHRCYRHTRTTTRNGNGTVAPLKKLEGHKLGVIGVGLDSTGRGMDQQSLSMMITTWSITHSLTHSLTPVGVSSSLDHRIIVWNLEKESEALTIDAGPGCYPCGNHIILTRCSK